MPISRKRQAERMKTYVSTERMETHVSTELAGSHELNGQALSDNTDRDDTPVQLRPYVSLGIELVARSGGQLDAECPFCGREKFSVEESTGKCRCWSCQLKGAPKGGLNPLGFIEQFWRHSSDQNTEENLEPLRTDRKLLSSESLNQWGVTLSGITDEYLVSSYDARGKFHQLYRYLEIWDHQRNSSKRLIPTPGIWEKGKVHGIFAQIGTLPLNNRIDTVYLCEGVWDAIALWEVLSTHKLGSKRKLVPVNSVGLSELSHSVILATPGCKVFNDQWIELFSGKRLITLYDNDHPKKVGNNILEPDGLWGTKRVCINCFSSRMTKAPRSMEYLEWGEDGYDPEIASGTDIRDVITEHVSRRVSSYDPNYEPEPPDDSLGQRAENLEYVYKHIRVVPDEWLAKAADEKITGKSITAKTCTDWNRLKEAWEKAMLWRTDLEDIFVCMLAVAVSTEQQGDQLFLQVIGDAGSGKTRFCDAMLVSKSCYPLEHITGFHSGWKDSSGEDHSLLARIDRKTLITPEGDTMMSSPRFSEIMSQQRRIFDGTSGASFKNEKKDKRYTALRTPWIIAGTPALLDADQTRLGDRFLRVIIGVPTDDECDRILDKVAYDALSSVKITSTPNPESTISHNQRIAYELTGGFVNYLRDSAEELLNQISVDANYIISVAKLLGQYAAFLRARPDMDMRKDSKNTKELPTRLTAQFARLMCCLSAVKGYRQLGESTKDVIRIAKKVAEDTASGKTKELVYGLHRQPRDKGMSLYSIENLLDYSGEKASRILRFLMGIGAVESFKRDNAKKSNSYYRLTTKLESLLNRMRTLCL